MGCAKDIVEHVGVPRFYYSEFPLGHSAGKPFDHESQKHTLRSALALLDSATQPRTTVVSPQTWSIDNSWQADYCSLEGIDVEAAHAAHESDRNQKRDSGDGSQ